MVFRRLGFIRDNNDISLLRNNSYKLHFELNTSEEPEQTEWRLFFGVSLQTRRVRCENRVGRL